MSTKLLRSVTDEKADMQKQLGCMNGIFQLFGRATSHNHKRLPPGTSQDNHHEMEQNCTTKKSLKNIPTQFMKEKKLMTGVELSRTSCSSSCSSSTFSSADCNKTSQSEPSSSSHSNFPEMTSLVSPLKQPNSSLQLSRQSVDLRDIVKESMYKQSPGLSIKTNTREEKAYEAIKLKDSPRPLQQHKHIQSEVNRRDVSLRVLAKPNEERYSALPLASRDSPRYSYDETVSRRKLKSTTKLKELPRLSLDSRERSPRISSSECRRNQMSRKDEESRVPGQIITENQEPGSNKKPSAIVARLMGFEPIPDSAPTEGQVIEVKSCLLEESETISPSLKVRAGNRQSKGSGFPNVHCKKSVSPRLKNDSVFTDSTSGSTFSVEQAQMAQIDSNKGSRRQSMNHQEASTKLPLASSSVYSEIKKRLSELEFTKAGKDLRALKQMIEAMEKTKDSLDSNKNEEQNPNSEPCTSQSSSNQASAQRRKCNSPVSPIEGSTSPKNRGTRIVKNKPSKLNGNSAIPNDGKSCLQKTWSGENAENIKNFAERRTAREISPRNNYRRDSSGWPLPYIEEKKISEPIKSLQRPKTSQQIVTEKLANFRKSSRNLSPRMQQKKHGTEKLSGFTTQSSDLKMSRMQSIKLPTESSSPTRRHCQKPANLQKRDDQIRRSTTSPRNMNHGDGGDSMQTENAIQLDVQIDKERESKSTYRTKEISNPYKPKDPNKEDTTAKYAEERLVTKLTAPLEQPSPVSVLDITFYEDDNPSPVKKISTAFQDNGNVNSDESEWSTVYIDCLHSSRGSKLNQRTLDDVGELGLLNTSRDKAAINHSEFVTNPNHIYIAEILLSTGLLRDLGSSTTTTSIQINPAGLLVNPELYHVLEKDTELALEHLNKKSVRSKQREKVQRRLVFDAVSEILLEGSVDFRSVQNKLGERTMTGEKLLEELCTKLDQQQATPDDSLYDIDDELISILRADIMNQRENWTGYSSQLPGLVLDLERTIFKDLISEIVNGLAFPHPGQDGKELAST